MNEPKVSITSDGLIQHTHIMVGDKELRVTKAVVTFQVDQPAKLKLETYVDLVDIKVLQKDTKLVIRNLSKDKRHG